MDITPTSLAQACDISVPYASQLLSGTRSPSNAVALRVYRQFKLKLGVMQGLDDAAAHAVANSIEGRLDHAAPDNAATQHVSAGKSGDVTAAGVGA